jgi:hypothetical protein
MDSRLALVTNRTCRRLTRIRELERLQLGFEQAGSDGNLWRVSEWRLNGEVADGGLAGLGQKSLLAGVTLPKRS